jgi:hypothetical protein
VPNRNINHCLSFRADWDYCRLSVVHSDLPAFAKLTNLGVTGRSPKVDSQPRYYLA